jgi:hypothetical protein
MRSYDFLLQDYSALGGGGMLGYSGMLRMS